MNLPAAPSDLVRPILIALIPVVPAAIGVVVWLTVLGDNVTANVTKIAALEKVIADYDLHGSRTTNALDARIRALETMSVEHDRQLAAVEARLNMAVERIALIEERERQAFETIRQGAALSDENNRMIRELLNRVAPKAAPP
jgi:hypothetical protein